MIAQVNLQIGNRVKLGLATLTIILLIPSQATAANLSITIPLDLGPFSSVLNELDFLGLPDNFLDIFTGDIGLPDLNQVEAKIPEYLEDVGLDSRVYDILTGSLIGGEGSDRLHQQIYDEIRLKVAKANVDGHLSSEAQQQKAETAAEISEKTELSVEKAIDSENQDVSQNILRNISTLR